MQTFLLFDFLYGEPRQYLRGEKNVKGGEKIVALFC